MRGFLLRGLEKVRGEWALICLTHNILKMHTLCHGWQQENAVRRVRGGFCEARKTVAARCWPRPIDSEPGPGLCGTSKPPARNSTQHKNCAKLILRPALALGAPVLATADSLCLAINDGLAYPHFTETAGSLVRSGRNTPFQRSGRIGTGATYMGTCRSYGMRFL